MTRTTRYAEAPPSRPPSGRGEGTPMPTAVRLTAAPPSGAHLRGIDDEDWHRLDQILAAALALPKERRAAYLDEICAGHSGLRTKLESLLAEDRQLHSFLEQPAGARMETGPVKIGDFRVIGLLGTGGMGAVYLAEQREPVERRVALKLIRAGLDSEQVLSRFESEGRALARLEHPNVAKIYQVGTTADSRPYFAMEYVAGTNIGAHCDRYHLDLVQRVELFVQVCSGVEHAHQKGMIHRDLKPSNILVKSAEGQGSTVKIIDFGVAKSVQSEPSCQSNRTQFGGFVGTPQYSSPEQIEGRYAATDTRSDLYSLGVVLYQLLVGVAPFDAEDFTGKSQPEIAEMLRHRRPLLPARRLAPIDGELASLAERRSTSAERLIRQLSGDLSWILSRCLEYRPDDRYSSVLELRKDLQRWLDDRPVEAQPTHGLYRLGKLARRHRAAATVAVLVGATLLATTSAAVVGLLRADRAAAQARRAAEEAEMVLAFQTEQLRSIDPLSMGLDLQAGIEEAWRQEWTGQDTGLEKNPAQEEWRQVLASIDLADLALATLDEHLFAHARRDIETQYGDRPLLQARLWQSLANTLAGLGRWSEALEVQERALAVRRAALGQEHSLTLESLLARGRLHLQLRRLEMAEPDLVQVFNGLVRTLGPSHPATLATQSDLDLLRQLQERPAGSTVALQASTVKAQP